MLVLPEAVVLAEILMDPIWRRRIGLAELFYEQRSFYQHVARRLGLRGWASGLHTGEDPCAVGSSSIKPSAETPRNSLP
ncbi:hypothetical protein [Nocardia sp. NBC_01327]|uniref:hypothetical protein n=1 Tax=Nocardia sp. NBC_01327 TaxID=2903593 RepID=UPI002E11C101|nr:hypothetical protein OG326_42890 [Nocardia sp. NBC_01327]